MQDERPALAVPSPAMVFVPGAYPDNDLFSAITTRPEDRPFAIVADTDELVPEIAYRGRSDKEPLLLSLARTGWARVFATDRVHEEVKRQLPQFAGDNADAAMRTFREEYEPLIRWVAVSERATAGYRADEDALMQRMSLVHVNDAPTAELAILCAPCFLHTRNLKHFPGIARPRTRDAIIAAGDSAELELSGRLTLVLTELGVRATSAAVKRAVAAAADSPLFAGAMLALLLLIGHRALERRDEIRQAGSRAADRVGEAAEQLSVYRQAQASRVGRALVDPLEPVTYETSIALVLSRAMRPVAADELAIAARPSLDREAALEALQGHPAFEFWPGRGWTLGRHVDRRADRHLAPGSYVDGSGRTTSRPPSSDFSTT